LYLRGATSLLCEKFSEGSWSVYRKIADSVGDELREGPVENSKQLLDKLRLVLCCSHRWMENTVDIDEDRVEMSPFVLGYNSRSKRELSPEPVDEFDFLQTHFVCALVELMDDKGGGKENR
jgi:hypothetical protein